jgi:hypothetical protein
LTLISQGRSRDTTTCDWTFSLLSRIHVGSVGLMCHRFGGLPYFYPGPCLSGVEAGLLKELHPLAVRRKGTMTEATKI